MIPSGQIGPYLKIKLQFSYSVFRSLGEQHTEKLYNNFKKCLVTWWVIKDKETF